MDLYYLTLAFLAVTSCYLAWMHHSESQASRRSKAAASGNVLESQADGKRFRAVFLVVYLLVMGSDWLQGAYVYTLYKDEKKLAETVVAGLFTCGFLAAAVSALVVGYLADRYGRRLACLAFCATYSVGCLTKISNDVTILFLGRLLGGFSTTLMYSAFESWMVTEYFAQGLDRSSMSLDSMFGIMTTLNSVVAILSGLVGEGLVMATGTKVSPFLAAVVCLGVAAWFMVRYWGENYGDGAELKRLGIPKKSALKGLFRDKGILILGFVSCGVEGSMYIFVFYWSAAMESAHAYTRGGDATGIPYGIIFASFMAAMMLGSLGFTYLSATAAAAAASRTARAPPSALLSLSAAAAAASLLVTVLVKHEAIVLWAFCLFEASLGVYFPAAAAQRAMMVDDGVRAGVYSVLRIPLNVFVVVALTTTVEGDAHRELVFVSCGGLLLLASLAAQLLKQQVVAKEEGE